MSKNIKTLESFSEYCQRHPELRFWQALRNWTRENVDADCNFIYIAPAECLEWMMEGKDNLVVDSLKDTFYYED